LHFQVAHRFFLKKVAIYNVVSSIPFGFSNNQLVQIEYGFENTSKYENVFYTSMRKNIFGNHVLL